MGLFQIRKRNKKKGVTRDLSSNQALRRSKVRFARIADRYGVQIAERNPELMAAVAMKQLGHLEEYKLYNPPPTEAPKQMTAVEQAQEEMKVSLLRQAMENIKKDPTLVNHAAMREIYGLLGVADPTSDAEDYEVGDYAGPATGMGTFLQQLQEFKEVQKELGIESKGTGFSSMITPELLGQIVALVTAIVANKQAAMPQQYERYTEQKQQEEAGPVQQHPVSIDKPPQPHSLPDQPPPNRLSEVSSQQGTEGVHRVVSGNGPEGMELSGRALYISDEDRPQGMEPNFSTHTPIERPTGMEPDLDMGLMNEGEASDGGIPVALNITEWGDWLDRDPSEFVMDLAMRATSGNPEAQGTLDYFRAYTCDEIADFLQKQRELVDDEELVDAIDTLLERRDWLQAAITYVHEQ